MNHVEDFMVRMKMIRKGGAGLPPRWMRDSLMTEHLGSDMLKKLSLVHRAKQKRGEQI